MVEIQVGGNTGTGFSQIHNKVTQKVTQCNAPLHRKQSNDYHYNYMAKKSNDYRYKLQVTVIVTCNLRYVTVTDPTLTMTLKNGMEKLLA